MLVTPDMHLSDYIITMVAGMRQAIPMFTSLNGVWTIV